MSDRKKNLKRILWLGITLMIISSVIFSFGILYIEITVFNHKKNLQILATGNYPSEEMINNWDTMTVEQFLQVLDEKEDPGNIEQLTPIIKYNMGKISLLKNKRNVIIFWSFLFLVFGLILIYCSDKFKND